MLAKIKTLFNEFKTVKKIKTEAKSILSEPYTDSFSVDIPEVFNDIASKKIIDDSNRLLNGEYQIFNYPSYNNLNWQRDPQSGLKTSRVLPASLIRTSTLVNKADVKNYWEQSHLYAVLTLGEAYATVKEDKYADKLLELVFDFDDKNDCGKTVSWKCPMDVAIRLANIVIGAFLIKDSEIFKKENERITKIIAEHTSFVVKNYENKGEFPNNHYISDIVGVIFGSAYIYKTRQSSIYKNYLDDAVSRLRKECERQIDGDGFDYENSTYYHCFVTELLCETVSLLKSNSLDCDETVMVCAEKALSVCDKIGAFDNTLVLIGDQDGSRLFNWFGFFDINRCDFKSLNRFFDCNVECSGESAGIHILQKGEWRVFFKCGNVGTGGKGTHDHNDQLSVCIYYKNKPIVIDSGTYCYTLSTEERQKFRSVKSHSTAFFGVREQNDIKDTFSLKTKNFGFIEQKDKDIVVGVFEYSDGLVHKRKVELTEKGVCITDMCAEDSGVSRFIFAPDLVIVSEPQSKKLDLSKDESVKIEMTCDVEVCLGQCEVSSAYGIKQTTQYADAVFSNENIISIEAK